MAPRSRRSAAAATEAAQDVDEDQDQEQRPAVGEAHDEGLRKLHFKQPLVGRPGKPVSVADP